MPPYSLHDNQVSTSSSSERRNIASIGVLEHRVNCIIGVNPEERVNTQDILIDIEVQYDISKAAASDNVVDTFSYVDLRDLATELATTRKYQLLETFCVEFIDRVEKDYISKGVLSCFIQIKKPEVMKTTKYPYVALKRNFVQF